MQPARSTAKTIDEYIAEFPPAVQAILQKVRKTIRKAAPDAGEAMKYAIPTFVLNGNLVHFAAYERHVGFYPGAAGIAAFAKKLAGYKSAKGSVQFPLDRAIPYDLIAEIVKFRVEEQQQKKTTSRRAPAQRPR